MFEAAKSFFAYQKGKRALKQRHYAQAERHFKAALAQSENNEKALAGLVSSYVAQQAFASALASHEQLMTRTEKLKPVYRAQDYVTKAQLLLKLERFEDAASAFEEALALDDDNPQARLGRARILAASGEHNAAMDLIKAVQLPDDAQPDVLQAIAEVYLGAGEYPKAEVFFLRWLSVVPDDPMAKLGLVKTQQGQGKHQEAKRLVEELLEAYPKDAQLHLQQAQMLQQAGDYDAALKAVDQARRLDPADAQVYFIRGDVFLDAKHYSEAKRMFDKAIAIHPQHAPAYAQRGLCKVLMSQGEAHGISRDFEFAEQFGGFSPLVRRNRAIYAFALQNYDRSATLLEELLATYPRFKWGYFYLGLVETARHNPTAAQAAFTQALENGEQAAREYLGAS